MFKCDLYYKDLRTSLYDKIAQGAASFVDWSSLETHLYLMKNCNFTILNLHVKEENVNNAISVLNNICQHQHRVGSCLQVLRHKHITDGIFVLITRNTIKVD